MRQWFQSNLVLSLALPHRFIPVPVIGSAALFKRAKHQEQENRQHRSRLEVGGAGVGVVEVGGAGVGVVEVGVVEVGGVGVGVVEVGG